MAYKSAKIYTGSEWADIAVSVPNVHLRQINNVTNTSYTLSLNDAGKALLMANSSPMTLTIPPDSSVAFAVGQTIIVYPTGAGAVTVQAGSGVTLRSLASKVASSGQYAQLSLLKINTDEWVLSGDLA